MFDLIIGSHSIFHALKNNQRNQNQLFATNDGLKEFKKKYPSVDVDCEILSNLGELNNKATGLAKELGVKVPKLPSNIFLKTNKLIEKGNAWLYDFVESHKAVKLLALDRVTDIHNAAAIMRTAAFFKVNAMIVGNKSSFGMTPAFFRISSGAFEYVNLVQVPSLPKTLSKLVDKGVKIIGFSEEINNNEEVKDSRSCLVFGSEEFGLSHAVERVLTHHVSLESDSPINSLNVSVAAAIGMQKFISS